MNPVILEWQKALPSFGIVYSGPQDGMSNSQFVEAMMRFEAKYKAYGEVYLGSSPKMSVEQAKKKFQPVNKETDGKTPESKTDKEPTDTKSIDIKVDKVWESFLQQTLPTIGKSYLDPAQASQELENFISKKINKSVTGMIWNDSKKTFNTTPDDVRKALELIESNQKNTDKTAIDQRMYLMSKFLSKKA